MVITRKGVDRWKRQVPWIYRTDIAEEPAGLEGGEVVRVVDERGWFLGQAFFSRHSKIVLRALTHDDRVIDEGFFRERIERADALRRRALPDEDTYRVVCLLYTSDAADEL